ncbi:MAG: hypothetical protein O7F12_11100 [Nitrospirae bacterium]|nr:hypothetical protein [Nitrospirota bacterium]
MPVRCSAPARKRETGKDEVTYKTIHFLECLVAFGVAEQCSRLRGFRRALFERSELRSRRRRRTAQGTPDENVEKGRQRRSRGSKPLTY